MAAMLSWLLGGNRYKHHPGSKFPITISVHIMQMKLFIVYSSKLEGRPLGCRFSDKANDQTYRWFQDHDALEEAMGGQWYLFPTVEGNSNTLQPIRLIRDEQRSLSLGLVITIN
ncbi:zeaxanthin epoxidase, chloroplastic-like isoform X3 [Miscanthus floridulus]|uniref:zeaxanthin epoxidase, chloroplastic-like isoform X3 n=1 Tax=Miscanthus floridulus TaxID=154761 RepID=UPI0034589266